MRDGVLSIVPAARSDKLGEAPILLGATITKEAAAAAGERHVGTRQETIDEDDKRSALDKCIRFE